MASITVCSCPESTRAISVNTAPRARLGIALKMLATALAPISVMSGTTNSMGIVAIARLVVSSSNVAICSAACCSGMRESTIDSAVGCTVRRMAEDATGSIVPRMAAAHSSGTRSSACPASQESIPASACPAGAGSIISSREACCSAYSVPSMRTTCGTAPAAGVRPLPPPPQGGVGVSLANVGASPPAPRAAPAAAGAAAGRSASAPRTPGCPGCAAAAPRSPLAGWVPPACPASRR